MKTLTIAAALLAASALAGCNTWQGAKQDARIAGEKTVEGTKKVANAVGTGLEKAGEGINNAGQAVKNKID
ncbi:MAG: entericidin EcnAB [Comamonas sp.]